MLLESDRYREGDLEAWERNERMDALHARNSGLGRRVVAARNALREFIDLDPTNGYLGVSWGKDSVVAAHLMSQMERQLPVVWIKIWPLFNPDCERVRDAFLAKHDIDYHEIEVPWRQEQVDVWAEQARKGQTMSAGYSPIESAAVAGFKDAANRFGVRHISGVRAEESGVRKLRMKIHGHSSKNTCAPIGYWSTQDVFAYLHACKLPVHPAYAMTFGGILDRERLRVDGLGGGKGSDRPRWEGTYYADRIRMIQDLALGIEPLKI